MVVLSPSLESKENLQRASTAFAKYYRPDIGEDLNPRLPLIVAAEVTLWAKNPMNIPTAFAPARAFGLQALKKADSSMWPTQ